MEDVECPQDLFDAAFFHACLDDWSDPIAFAAGATWASWVLTFVAMGEWARRMEACRVAREYTFSQGCACMGECLC